MECGAFQRIVHPDDSLPMSNSNIGTFKSKFVYNIDDSTYILDPKNATISGVSSNTCIRVAAISVTNAKVSTAKITATKYKTVDVISAKNENAILKKQLLDLELNNNPKLQTFRVIFAEEAKLLHHYDTKEFLETAPNTIFEMQKSILMCFICKLSFGITKSFILHANNEHGLDIKDLEKKLLLQHEYSSAIIQRNMEKEPQILFLEPLDNDCKIVKSESNIDKQTMLIENKKSKVYQTSHDTGLMSQPLGKEHRSLQHIHNEDATIDIGTKTSTPKLNTLSSLKSKKSHVSTTRALTDTLANKIIIKTNVKPSSTTHHEVATITTIAPILDSTSCLTGKVVVSHENHELPFHVTRQAHNSPINKILKSPTPSCASLDSFLHQKVQKIAAASKTERELALTIENNFTSTLAGTTEVLTSWSHQRNSPNIFGAPLGGSISYPRALPASTHFDYIPEPLATLHTVRRDAGVKFINELFQAVQQHQEKPLSHYLNNQSWRPIITPIISSPHTPLAALCSEKIDEKKVDCEILDIPLQVKSSPQRSLSETNLADIDSAAKTLSLTSPTLTSHVNASSIKASFHASNVVNACGPPTLSQASLTIGACSEHINGRPIGMDCARCEIILNSARLSTNVPMSTRNSCKTLKCPQCNWHYKYQETLEIHMREKHPDGESACGYCLAGQQHPRLARGESYSCGYKPYRCEICNYSTTTKGNLSIHMQSDKHLNNIQELNSSQNIVAAAIAAANAAVAGKTEKSEKLAVTHQQKEENIQQQTKSIDSSNSGSCGSTLTTNNCRSPNNVLTVSCSSATANCAKQKPSFRCDICSYETSVARNLRIHMTSEKHTHNVTVLQNNIKHIQALSFLHHQHQEQQQANFIPGVAFADFSYNHALMVQLLHQNPATPSTVSLTHTDVGHIQSKESDRVPQLLQFKNRNNSKSTQLSPGYSEIPLSPKISSDDQTINAESCSLNDSPPFNVDPWPTMLYSCLICSKFSSNSLDELNQHLLSDRSQQSPTLLDQIHSSTPNASDTSPSQACLDSSSPENSNTNARYFSNPPANVLLNELMVIQNNNYICRICNYKTNLKANFQLHSKTEKHLQKLNFINHVREGGIQNEAKLKYYQHQFQIGTNTVQIKCNCCDFYTNSIQKLSLHTQHMRHDTMFMVFKHFNSLLKEQHATATTNYSVHSSTSTVVGAKSPQLDTKPKQFLICQVCNHRAITLLEMLQHVKSLRHIQVEHFVSLQRYGEQLDKPSLDYMFAVKEVEKIDTMDIFSDHIAKQNEMQTTLIHRAGGDFHESKNSSKVLQINVLPDFINETCDNSNLTGTETLAFSPISNFSGNSFNSIRNHEEIFPDQQPQVLQSNETGLQKMSIVGKIPIIIYKCQHCDFFSQTKHEMEVHVSDMHVGNQGKDYISIPTNPMAIQAFHAAMTAAAFAAGIKASPVKGKPLKIFNEFTTEINTISPSTIRKSEECINEHETEDCDGSKLAVIKEENFELVYENESEVLANLKQNELSNKTKERLEYSTLNMQCPLCQDFFREKDLLQSHLMTVHSVNNDGLERLLQLVDNSIWHNINTNSSNNYINLESTKKSCVGQNSPQKHQLNHKTTFTLTSTNLQCQQCGAFFKHEPELLQHAQKMRHFSMQRDEYICLAANSYWKPCTMRFATLTAMFTHYNDTHMGLVVSDRHVYKYRCRQCSLAFKTPEKLASHTLYHTMRDATKCGICQRNFRSAQAMQKHMDQIHNQIISKNDIATNTCIRECNSSPINSSTDTKSEHIVSLSENNAITSSSSTYACDGLDQYNATISSPTRVMNEILTNSQMTPTLQQHMTAITVALLKKQQQFSSSEMLKQLYCIQEQHFDQLPDVQNVQHLSRSASTATSTGVLINPLEIFNFMQFQHHIMSLNFMNLAPPLIFGDNTVDAGTSNINIHSTKNSEKTPSLTTHTSILKLSPTRETPTTPRALPTADIGSQLFQQKQQISLGIPNLQLTNNQKRARTRITDEQLKILRAHFDINNSPSEESITEMSQKANLPMKVVKHWFRNTLFKERQRNKDSPYNFNNPPSTTLNLEEYERTGHAKISPLKDTDNNIKTHKEIDKDQSGSCLAHTNQNALKQDYYQRHKNDLDGHTHTGFGSEFTTKSEPKEECSSNSSINSVDQTQKETNCPTSLSIYNQQQRENYDLTGSPFPTHLQQSSITCVNSYETKSESETSDMHSRSSTPQSAATMFASMNDLLIHHLETLPLNSMSVITENNMGPPKKLQISGSNSNNNERVMNNNTTNVLNERNLSANIIGVSNCSNKVFEKNSPSHVPYDNNSNSSNSSTTSSGKRANRTRFTDYQIKVLQEFFENNSYPKDSDLEYLSKLLLLSPRVIVVWFQNARQKQRKIYENQPNNLHYETEEKKQNINYACKKCNLVFQRYYELIRHQKNHCFKEENNKKSAKAQIAAAQLAQNLSSEDSNSSVDINNAAVAAITLLSTGDQSSTPTSTIINKQFQKISHFDTFQVTPSAGCTPPFEQHKYDCDKCTLSFVHFELLREHQVIHFIHPNLHLDETRVTSIQQISTHQQENTYVPISNILQNLPQMTHVQQEKVVAEPPNKKSKYSERPSSVDDICSLSDQSQKGSDYESHAKKYNFLYQYFLRHENSSIIDSPSTDIEFSMDFLLNYYQQSERKKRNDYEFLFQYYLQNVQEPSNLKNNKPNLEFLLQYYQLCESKKFFQIRTISPATTEYNDNIISGKIDTPTRGKCDGDDEREVGSGRKLNDLLLSKIVAQKYDLSDETYQYQHHIQNQFYKEGNSFNIGNTSEHNNNKCVSPKPNERTPDEYDCVSQPVKPINENSNFKYIHLSQKRQKTPPNTVEYMDQLDGLVELKSHNSHNHENIIFERFSIHSSPCLPSLAISPLNISLRPINYQLSNLSDVMSVSMITNKKIKTFQNPQNYLRKNDDGSRDADPVFNIISNKQRALKTENNTNVKTTTTTPCNISNCSIAEIKQNKRMRTTILPEQLSFLYECYHNESNPSRKMLEEISRNIKLKKRVVQVWFQNSRAKYKKTRNQQRQHIFNTADDKRNNMKVLTASSSNNMIKKYREFTTSTSSTDPFHNPYLSQKEELKWTMFSSLSNC